MPAQAGIQTCPNRNVSGKNGFFNFTLRIAACAGMTIQVLLY